MLLDGRAGRVDFYRGLALVFMFWDHIPGNIMGYATIRNLGLSDAAEIFVFLSGYSAILAYGRVMRRDGCTSALLRILKRAWRLYVVHIFLLVFLIGILFLFNRCIDGRDFIAEMRLARFITDPQGLMIDALLLRFKPNLMDPLPLYIVLMLGLAVVFPFLVRWPGRTLAASFALYTLVSFFGWNLPGQNEERWFFNPFAWQFLFVLGGTCALGGINAPFRPAPFSRALLGAAVVTFVLGAVLALSWRWPGLHERIMPDAVGAFIYPISKTNLAPLRLLHFAALALVVATVLPAGEWLNNPLGRLLRLIGRHGLEAFCFSVLLSPFADLIGSLSGDLWAVQILAALGGVGLMAGLAFILEWPAARPLPASSQASSPASGP